MAAEARGAIARVEDVGGARSVQLAGCGALCTLAYGSAFTSLNRVPNSGLRCLRGRIDGGVET